jgi:adenosylcobinamide-phosphate synthase
MIGYKNSIFNKIGWFGANCDKILNFIPARLTAFLMVLSAMIIRNDWKKCYQMIIRDSSKTESPNAGYPIAAMAGALETKFEKIDHYTIGDGKLVLTTEHIKSSLILMKVTSILFCAIVTIPIIFALSYIGWWIHA